MKRWAATLRLDVVNQYRQGFYLATTFVLFAIMLFVTLLPPVKADTVIPAILLTNMTIATYVFLGGLVLLEKTEGALEAIIVSPLRPEEYLASKIVTLTALAVTENILITGAAIMAGWLSPVGWGWILLGSALTGALYTTLGFLTVIRYDSFNDFLMPMLFATVILELPAAVCLGMPEFSLLIVLPTYALLWILRAAFQPVPAVTMVYAIGYPCLWIILAFVLSRGMLRSYVAGQVRRTSA